MSFVRFRNHRNSSAQCSVGNLLGRAGLIAGGFALGFAGQASAQCQFEWEGGFGRAGTYTESSGVYASVIHDDGSGSATYFAGEFTFLDGMWAPTGLVRYRNGKGESIADGSLTTQSFGVGIRALASWDPDGAGPLPAVLVVGGANWSGISQAHVARWDGVSFAEFPPLAWTGSLGPGVQAMATFDSDNDGIDELYVAGDLRNDDFLFGVGRWNQHSTVGTLSDSPA